MSRATRLPRVVKCLSAAKRYATSTARCLASCKPKSPHSAPVRIFVTSAAGFWCCQSCERVTRQQVFSLADRAISSAFAFAAFALLFADRVGEAGATVASTMPSSQYEAFVSNRARVSILLLRWTGRSYRQDNFVKQMRDSSPIGR